MNLTTNMIASDSRIRVYVGRLEPMLRRLTRPIQHLLDVVSTRGGVVSTRGDVVSTRADVASTVSHSKWDTVDVTSPRAPPTQHCVDLMSTQVAANLMGGRQIVAPGWCSVARGWRNGRLDIATGAVASASASHHRGCSMQSRTKPT